jgi:hypothetical protein
MYRKQARIKPISPKLWEEFPDIMEFDLINDDAIEFLVETNTPTINQRTLWKLIDRLEAKQRRMVIAFMRGNSYGDINVSEKTWRYNLEKGIKFMRKELFDTPYQLKVKSDFNRRIK